MFGADQVIPPDVLKRAKGLAIITVLKAGFLFSGRAGSGVIVARLRDGTWSAPSGISMAGAGAGGLVGVELTDFVFILNSANAVKSFSEMGSITLGGNISVSAGPLGRNAEAAGSASAGGVASVFAYSKSKGLFAGVSVEGSVIVERRDANSKFYGRECTAKQILSGRVRPPPACDTLFRVLESRAFNYQNSYDDYYGEQHSTDFYDDIPDSFADTDVSSTRPNTNSSRWRGNTDDSRSYRSTNSDEYGYDDDRRSDYGGGRRDDYDDYGDRRDDYGSSRRDDYDRRDDYGRRDERSPGRSSRYLDDGYDDRSRRGSGRYDDDRRYNADSPRDKRQSSYGDDYDTRGASGGARGYYDDQKSSRDNRDPYGGGNDYGRSASGSNQRYSSGGSYDRQPAVTSPSAVANPTSPGPTRTTGVRVRDDASTAGPKAVALYSFQGEERGDLSFRKGDVITIIKKSDSQNDWWTGRVNGLEGIFPANYVELV